MALTKVTGQVINDTTGLVVGVTTVGGGVSAVDGFFSGIITATGPVSISTNLTVGGSLSVGGTITYEDVTNIDAVGIITSRSDILVGSGITLSPDGDIFATGITTISENLKVGTGITISPDGDGFYTGVVTATSFSGDGSNLTGLSGVSVANQSDNRLITCTGTTDALNGEANLSYSSSSSLNLTDGNGTSNLGGNYLLLKRSTGNTNYINAPLADADLLLSADENIYFNTVHTADFNSTERFRIASAGQLGIGGANYGTSGQVLQSQGSSSAPQWATISGGVAKVAVRRYYGFVQYSSIGNAGFTEISEAYVDITPTSSSNYIKLGGLFCWEGSDTEDQYSFRWKRVITGGSTTSIDATQGAGNRPAVTYKTEGGAGGLICMQLSNIYDLPATTSSVRYYLEVFCDGANQTLYVNRTHADANDPRDERGASYFSAEEMNNSIFTYTNDT